MKTRIKKCCKYNEKLKIVSCDIVTFFIIHDFVILCVFSGGIVLEEDPKRCQGLCSTLYLRCTKCSYKSEMKTSNLCIGSQKSYDMNRRATVAMGELGLGREGMAEFSSIFDMPAPSNSDSWSEHNKTVHKAAKEALRD